MSHARLIIKAQDLEATLTSNNRITNLPKGILFNWDTLSIDREGNAFILISHSNIPQRRKFPKIIAEVGNLQQEQP